jgi:hypothetical protein
MAASSKRFHSHTAAAGAAGASARNSHAVGDSSQNKRAYIEAHGNDIFEDALASPTRRVSFNDNMNAYARMSPVGLCGCTRDLAISGSSISRSATARMVLQVRKTTGILKIRKPLSPGGSAAKSQRFIEPEHVWRMRELALEAQLDRKLQAWEAMEERVLAANNFLVFRKKGSAGASPIEDLSELAAVPALPVSTSMASAAHAAAAARTSAARARALANAPLVRAAPRTAPLPPPGPARVVVEAARAARAASQQAKSARASDPLSWFVRTGMHLVGVGPDSEPWGAGVAVPA